MRLFPVLLLMASPACAQTISHLEPAWAVGFNETVRPVKEEVRLKVDGHVWSDGMWRADLDKVEEFEVELFKAINERYYSAQRGHAVWRPPTWKQGWQRSEVVERYPVKFKFIKKVICYGTHCRQVTTLRF